MEEGAQNPWLKLIVAWLPVWTLAGSAVWGLYTYIHNQNRDKNKELMVRAHEIRKPYIDKRLEVVLAMSDIIGKLVGQEVNSAEWNRAEIQFRELAWGRFAFFEGKGDFRDFNEALKAYKEKPDGDNRDRFEKAAGKLVMGLGVETAEGMVRMMLAVPESSSENR